MSMEPALDLGIATINVSLAVILVGIFGVWMYFLVYMTKSFRLAPKLESFDYRFSGGHPKVSVILPARNEEQYIARCLDSLLDQDYPNFEVIAINDGSTDRTGEIISVYAQKDDRIVRVDTSSRPEGWVGKNWACAQGYAAAGGEYFFFTDADTEHAPNVISLAVGHMLAGRLEALTAVPKLLCNDIWTRITLPGLSTFLHTRFSPLRVNDPKQKTGYFFGSFFVIARKTYESVGTHAAVKGELVEDGALGAIVKAQGHRMKMVRGEQYIKAVWARDLNTLWHGLRRLMIPLYHQSRKDAYLIMMAVFFIMFAPFLILTYTIPILTLPDGKFSGPTGVGLAAIQGSTIGVVLLTTCVQCRFGVFQSPIYALGAPVGGALIFLAFASAIVDAKKKGSVLWRDRQYTLTEKQSFMR